MGRVFKTRHFARWTRKSGLSDRALCQAVDEMIAGLIDADLGGGLVKKRVGLPGRGKRGGARTLVATNKRSRWFFVFGFEKNACQRQRRGTRSAARPRRRLAGQSSAAVGRGRCGRNIAGDLP